MDRTTRRFRLPSGSSGGLAAAGLFAGALVLAALGVIATLILPGSAAPALVVLEIAALSVVVSSGAILLRRLGDAATAVEDTTREAEETGSRLRVLVEHVPAVVYIDMADPGVRRRPPCLHEPADRRDPRLPAGRVRR